MQVGSVARQAVKVVAATADRLLPPARGIVVLIYHRVGGGSGGEVDLPVEVFDEQVAHLCAQRAVVRLDEALRRLTGPEPEGPDPVVLTFDDGTADFVEHALPVLVRHRAPATLYAATHFLDTGAPFPGGAPPLTWSAVREASATGLVTVASHTHRHRLLDRLPPVEVADELDRSIDRIGEEVGARPDHFAYPKAVAPSAAAARAVADRFTSAALAGSVPNAYGATDPLRLARTPVQASDGRAWRGHTWFERKAAGGLGAEDRIRRLLNRGRYAGRTT